MQAQRPPTSTTVALSSSVFGQSRIEWHQNDTDLDRNKQNRIVDQVIIEESPLVNKQYVNENISKDYQKIDLSEIIDRFRLNRTDSTIQRSKCSCFFGLFNSVSPMDRVKKEILKLGADKFDSNNYYHKNSVYSIHCLLNNNHRINHNQFNILSKDVVLFFQLFQFLSCVEFETPLFQQLYQDKGFQLIEIMLNVGLFVYEQLQNNKLNAMIRNQQSQTLFNVLRNYQLGILLHLLKEMEEHNKEIQFLLNKYKSFNPYQFLDYYINRKNKIVFSF